MEPNVIIERISSYLPALAAALPVTIAVMVGTVVVSFLLDRLFTFLAVRTSLTEADLMPLRSLVRWGIRIVAIIIILGVLGFEIGGIWAMLSTVLAMVAIGFVAVWSLLSNTTSTLLILFLRPFQVGDDIELAGEPVQGRVIDLNFFYTTLLGSDGRLLQVPNNLFFQRTVKRRHGQPVATLAQQLHSPTASDLPPPPAESSPSVARSPAPDPLLSMPDPASMSPKMPGR